MQKSLRTTVVDDLHTNRPILIFVAGHGTVVQPASINIVFGYKQAQQCSGTYTSIRFYQSCRMDCTKC